MDLVGGNLSHEVNNKKVGIETNEILKQETYRLGIAFHSYHDSAVQILSMKK